MGLTASAGQRGRVCLQVVDGIATAAQRYRSQMQSSNDALTMLAWVLYSGTAREAISRRWARDADGGEGGGEVECQDRWTLTMCRRWQRIAAPRSSIGQQRQFCYGPAVPSPLSNLSHVQGAADCLAPNMTCKPGRLCSLWPSAQRSAALLCEPHMAATQTLIMRRRHKRSLRQLRAARTQHMYSVTAPTPLHQPRR